jgi:hypothetical protein
LRAQLHDLQSRVGVVDPEHQRMLGPPVEFLQVGP